MLVCHDYCRVLACRWQPQINGRGLCVCRMAGAKRPASAKAFHSVHPSCCSIFITVPHPYSSSSSSFILLYCFPHCGLYGIVMCTKSNSQAMIQKILWNEPTSCMFLEKDNFRLEITVKTEHASIKHGFPDKALS